MTFLEKSYGGEGERQPLHIVPPKGKTMTVFSSTPKHIFSIAYWTCYFKARKSE